MSDLLSIGASGVRAYNSALSAVGNNVSNADTPGYTRRTVSLAENTSGGASQFSGVDTASVGRAWDDYQAQAARTAAGDAGQTDATSTWLTNAETALNDTANGVGQSATSLFTAGDALAGDPSSTANRQGFLAALDQTASAFNSTAASLASVSSGIATSAQTTAQTVNATLDQIDKVNTALKTTTAGSSQAADLMDQRDRLLDTLSSNVGISVSLDNNGAATVSLTSSGLQMTGNPGARLTVASGTNGTLAVQAISGGKTQPVGTAGGSLGGLVESASTVADRRTALDKMASDFSSAINAWQAQGQTSSGAAGAALLSGTTAATISITTSDTTAIAAATSSASNGNLLTLSTLRGSTGLEQTWSNMVTDQGQMTAAAKSADTAATSIASSTMDARNTTSGVDLNTEAAEMIRYQQAYNAAAKIIQTSKDTMQSILDLF
ncbi:flagellar hook-associated protein FlgK [Sphingomonas abietis]|uniref:Flagellar hook-associated protein 1 n=1 Tax=Sphingomonas abietis TaxID=3012344 RepID=A0ABY7NNC7_9SPHN|nr:flagellar hook-associated protein FlgK [Sphingomonas abietis]WBO22138.1 flagellar hook-associated protein FlgK [Sphingomonas abietis]